MRVIVIGGGAAGLMAAVMAAGEGAAVTVLEQNGQWKMQPDQCEAGSAGISQQSGGVSLACDLRLSPA